MVFCNTKREPQEVAETLSEHGFSALTGEDDIASGQVSKIKVQERRAYVAVSRGEAQGALVPRP